jgi:hypothetical protein
MHFYGQKQCYKEHKMNQRKLKLELMRAILRSSKLEYDDVYPILNKIYLPIEQEIVHSEKIKAQKKEIEYAKSKAVS